MSSTSLAFTTAAVPLLWDPSTAPPLSSWHDRSSRAAAAAAAAAKSFAPPRARVRRRSALGTPLLLSSSSSSSAADRAAEESYYLRQAARKTFADDVQASIQERQERQERELGAVAAAVARPSRKRAPPGTVRQGSSSIGDNPLRKPSEQQQRHEAQDGGAPRAQPGALGSSSSSSSSRKDLSQEQEKQQRRRRRQRQPSGAGGRTAGNAADVISHEANMRQGRFLFTVKQMTNRRDFAGVLRMLREAEGQPGGATPKMYSCCIGYMGRGGNWEGALDVLARMHASGKTPDAFCVNDGMNACKRAGKHDKALWVFEQARDVWGTQLDSYVSFCM